MNFRYLMSAVMIASLGACDVETSTTVPQSSQPATKIPRTGTAQSVRDFQVVAAQDVGILALHSRVKVPDLQQIFSHSRPLQCRVVS